MYAIGGLVCANGALTTQETLTGQRGQGLVAATFLCGAALIALVGPRVRLLQGALFLSIALLSCLVATASPLGTTPFFYLWPLANAAYFDGVRMRIATFACLAGTLATGLLLNAGLDHRFDIFSGTIVSVGVMTWLVATIRDREQAQRKLLIRAAETDHLTGLLNRRAFEPELLRLVSDASEDHPASIVLFDIDRFKRLNDEWGHQAGDRALERMANALRSASRGDDTIARLGGDEFVVALRNCDASGSREYAERVANKLETYEEPGLPPVHASYGTTTRTAPVPDAATVLGAADHALYAAKARRSRDLVAEPPAARAGWSAHH